MTRSTKATLCLVVAVAAAALLGILFVNTTQPPTPATTHDALGQTTPFDPLAVRKSTPEADATHIDLIGRQEFPDIYGGISTPDDGKTIIVHVTHDSTPFRVRVKLQAGSAKVIFTITRATLEDLAGVQKSIRTHEPRWQRQGIAVFGFGDDVTAGREDVLIIDLTPAKRRIVERALNAKIIHIANESSRDAARTHLAASRWVA